MELSAGGPGLMMSNGIAHFLISCVAVHSDESVCPFAYSSLLNLGMYRSTYFAD